MKQVVRRDKILRNVTDSYTRSHAPAWERVNFFIQGDKLLIMDIYICSICGYEYNPELGIPENGIDPGIEFEDLPDDWICPVCGASKDLFNKLDD